MLNTDIKTRDTLIFGKYEPEKYMGGIRRFEYMPVNVLEKLVKQKFINLKGRQNNAPSVKRFLSFMQKYPTYWAHGYAVDLARPDYRVSIEGVVNNDGYGSAEEFEEFSRLFQKADDFDANEYCMYCWYD